LPIFNEFLGIENQDSLNLNHLIVQQGKGGRGKGGEGKGKEGKGKK